MISPIQMAQLLKGGQNPQQLAMNLLRQQYGNTPMGANLLALAQKGDMASLEQIARNMCAQKGLDYDTEFAQFKKTLGM